MATELELYDMIPEQEITSTNTLVDLYTAPSNKIPFLTSLIVVNLSGAAATVEIWDGDKQRLFTLKLAADEVKKLSGDDLKGFRATTGSIKVKTDQQPIRVSGTVILK